jgi:phage shock protein C
MKIKNITGGVRLKRLYRSRQDRILGGVCGGLAEYFVIDTTLVRLLWILSVILGGAGVLAYIIAWVIIPEKPLAQATTTAANNTGGGDSPLEGDAFAGTETEFDAEVGARRASLAGVILIVLGSLFLLREFMPLWDLNRYWPVILIAAGVAFILRGLRGEER